MALHWKILRCASGSPLGITSACPLNSSGIPTLADEPVRRSQAWPKGIVERLACYNFLALQEVRPSYTESETLATRSTVLRGRAFWS
jgi:hypothetical protein